MTKFYRGKRVLVTGGASFIGSHLAERLVELGAKVTVVDDLSSGSYANLETIDSRYEFIFGDLRDQKTAIEATQSKDIVFHLANIHGGRGFIESHPGEIAQNFLIDGNVFLASKENGVGKICYTSSACAYPVNLQTANADPQHRYLSEEMADFSASGGANADGIYGWAKLMGELSLKSFGEQFGIKGVSCRLFTVYGPRENESHAIIAFIARALLKQDPYIIWGSGNQDRNFTYVDDVVEGVLRATERIDDCSAINIGTSEITKIKDAVMEVCRYLNFEPREFLFDKTKPEGVSARAASTKLQREKLDWEPSISFSDGIAKTIDWYKSVIDIDELRQKLEERLMER
jgi:UDP-glucose 4-epimerase